MAVPAEFPSSIDPAALLARQRSAFGAEGPPSLQLRRLNHNATRSPRATG